MLTDQIGERGRRLRSFLIKDNSVNDQKRFDRDHWRRDKRTD